MSSIDTSGSASIEQLVQLIRSYTLQFQHGVSANAGATSTEEILARLSAAGELLQAKADYFQNNQKRIDEILEVLMQYTMSDFSVRAKITAAGDELDAIALGLNTLAEELEASRNNEKKQILVLEAANKELKAFTYIASHDLQEPLRNIKMFSNIISERERGQLSDKGKQMLDKIDGATTRMQKLIEDLLAFSRVQSYTEEIRPVKLNDLLQEIKIGYEDDIKEGKIIIEANDLPVVNGIAFQLRQLLENIIGNSIKYAKANTAAHIKITAEVVKGNTFSKDAEPLKSYHKISIADNGIGFDPKYALRIFEIFQRLHAKQEYSGTGIGLAICNKVAQNHAGFIYAEGKPDEGTTFVTFLPA